MGGGGGGKQTVPFPVSDRVKLSFIHRKKGVSGTSKEKVIIVQVKET